ncbi:MAG: hypothetical protein HYY18_01485 [Planctomycetes bacterium]|nr:hypothetical protein [Planctomycetota bacterium]
MKRFTRVLFFAALLSAPSAADDKADEQDRQARERFARDAVRFEAGDRCRASSK